jgi:hypothetical protein
VPIIIVLLILNFGEKYDSWNIYGDFSNLIRDTGAGNSRASTLVDRILFIAMEAFAIYVERKSLQNSISSSRPEEKNAGGIISDSK